MSKPYFSLDQVDSIKNALDLHTLCMNCGEKIPMDCGGWIKMGFLKRIRLCCRCIDLAKARKIVEVFEYNSDV